MLSLSRQEMLPMSTDDIVSHVLSLQSEKEVFTRLHESALKEMTKSSLVAYAIKLQLEISRLQIQARTSGGAGP